MTQAIRYQSRASTQKASQTYARIGLETQILSASPKQLVALLFDGALASMRRAHLHFRNGDIPSRGQAISKAIAIIESGLQASVDSDAGGYLAENLIKVYDLVIYNLMRANLHGDIQKLELAQRLLTEISHAWKTAAAMPDASTSG